MVLCCDLSKRYCCDLPTGYCQRPTNKICIWQWHHWIYWVIIDQKKEYLAWQPRRVSEIFLFHVHWKLSAFRSFSKWARITHSNEDYAASKIQIDPLSTVPVLVVEGPDAITYPLSKRAISAYPILLNPMAYRGLSNKSRIVAFLLTRSNNHNVINVID